MKKSKISLALVGAIASALTPGLMAPPSAVAEVRSADYGQNHQTPASAAAATSTQVAAMPHGLVPLLAPPSRTTQFYANVPRYRGHRNGRPRGRRSYRSIHR